MGYAGDIFGRNTAMIITLSLVAIAALLSALAPTGSATQVYVTIIITRFFLGIGVGGVYPLSATKAAEDNSGHSDDGHGNGDVNISAAAFAFFWQVPGSMVSKRLYHLKLHVLTHSLYHRLLGSLPTSLLLLAMVVSLMILNGDFYLVSVLFLLF